MTTIARAPGAPAQLLARLIEAPQLVRAVRALAPTAFSALVREVGVEDAGEIVALATTEQLIASFDEDLFVNSRPGERERFDRRRFVVWLEVLLEAGAELAASRVAQLSEDFVIHALSSIVLVLDHDALLTRMRDGGSDAERADKAIESSISEEIDGYLLIARDHEGWDAVLDLILALDRDHRSYLERILDRSAQIASGYIDDLDELATALSADESLAEDVEAEREERRAAQGFVEPRAARSFLTLARAPLARGADADDRDPVTQAYFRDLERRGSWPSTQETGASKLMALLGPGEVATHSAPELALAASGEASSGERRPTLMDALLLLKEHSPEAFAERMEELAYLANVLLSGAEIERRRLRPAEASEAALATVGLGAQLEAADRAAAGRGASSLAFRDTLCDVLRDCRADLLFRKASSALAARGSPGFLRSFDEVEGASELLGEACSSEARARPEGGRRRKKPDRG
jgi:hypothetical protein